MRVLRKTYLQQVANAIEETEFDTPVELRRGFLIRIYRILLQIDPISLPDSTDTTYVTAALGSVSGFGGNDLWMGTTGLLALHRAKSDADFTNSIVIQYGAPFGVTEYGPSGLLCAAEKLYLYVNSANVTGDAKQRVACQVQYMLEEHKKEEIYLIQKTESQVEGD